MNWVNLLPLLVVLTTLGTGVVIFLLPEQSRRLRTVLNLTGAGLNLALVAVIVDLVFFDYTPAFRWTLLPGIDLLLRADAFATLFMILSAALWMVTTVYAVGYLEDSPNRSRFFGFFSLCVTSTMGVALAGNLFTFFIFY